MSGHDLLPELVDDPGAPLAPGPDVAIAIAIAVEECWPRPAASEVAATPIWRFSGRSWARPELLRRERPGW